MPDELFAQYGSWERVIEKSFSTNAGMDACLGLYDDYYYLYAAQGDVPADEPTAEDSGNDGTLHIGENTVWIRILRHVLSFILDVLRILNG